MGKRTYPLKRIKYWWAYDIDEICTLYKDYKLHPQTVRKWLGKGLHAMSGRPTLIYGQHLKEFLGEMNAAGKCKTDFDQLFCFKCQDAKIPLKRRVHIKYTKQQSLKLSGHCPDCKSVMFQDYSINDYQKIQRIFNVVDVLQLYDSEASPVKTHLDAQDESHESESPQWELF